MKVISRRSKWRFMVKPIFAIVLILATQLCLAQDSVKTTTTVNGFVDAYYSYAFSRPPTRERSYTTQPLRHNEFNLNLAMIDVKHQGETFRGRFAFQTGTYVQSNYAVEPTLLKNVLEASVGTRLGENVWIDIGIFPSHIGLEGIVSKDNWTYSRSMLADFSPYFETGISVTAAVSERVSLRGLVLNGWQNIQETNNDKAVGTQLQYKPAGSVLLNWSTFIGNEQPDSAASRLRFFNDLYAVLTLSEQWSLDVAFDIGFQKQTAGNSSYDSWNAASLMVRHTINKQWAITGRVEYFFDGKGVLIPTGTPDNFQTVGGSLNVDYSPVALLLWRVEARLLDSKSPIYPTRTGFTQRDGFVTLSAAISL